MVIDSHAIQHMPLNGRLNVIGLMALAPGVQSAGAQDQVPVSGVEPAIANRAKNSDGALGNTLDGITNQNISLQRAGGEVPPLNAIGEFKVIATGAPAEFVQPSQVIVVSASGTNQIHGEVLEYNRSKGTSAKSYFGGAQPRPAYERNEYGGSFGGPILIPHLYEGKGRSFFFAAWEGFRLSQSKNLNSQQPTVAQRSGDFSAITTHIINPATGTQFPGNVIPSTSLNSVDLQLLKALYPLPTTTGTGINTFELVPFTDDVTRFSLHIDHKINEKNQIRATWLRAFYGPFPTTGVDSLAGGFSGQGEHVSDFILGWTHTISPTLIVDTYSSFYHLPIFRTPQNVNTDFSSIIPGLGVVQIQGAPNISITNITNPSEAGSSDLEQDPQIYSSLTKILPKHTIKVGGSFLFNDHFNQACNRGTYSFNGKYSGNALADFMLGLPNSTGKNTPNCAIYRDNTEQYVAYVQDDWRATHKLSINVGLNYNLQWYLPNNYGLNAAYIPSLKEAVVFATNYNGTIPSVLASMPHALASQVGIPTNPFAYIGRQNKNFAPRFGFAYQILTNTVVRGGIGLYYSLQKSQQVYYSQNQPPYVGSTTYSQPASGPPAFTMDAPFSATGSLSANPSLNAATTGMQNPMSLEFNLNAEHEFTDGIDIRLGYVGQKNMRQLGGVFLNVNLASPPVVGVSVQSTNLVQPFSTLTNTNAPIFHSFMNSLQVGVQKRYRSGLMVSAQYQWTRLLGTESMEDTSGANLNDSYGNIGTITPQVLNFSYAYSLPFGHNQLMFGNVGAFANKVISGWQVSGISSFQTGQPFSVSYTAPGSPVGLVSGRANRVPGVPLYPSKKTLGEWFNPAAFTAPPCYNSVMTGSSTVSCSTVYSAGVAAGVTTYATYGTSGYNMLRGPAWQDWDMSLAKDISLHDRYTLQLRADSFNIFNHPNFAIPNASISNTSTVGTITSTSGSPSYEPRTVEFAAKFSF